MRRFVAVAALALLALGLGVVRRADAASFGFGASSGTVLGMNIIGICGELNFPLAERHAALNLDVRYEYGNFKSENSSAVPTTTYEQTAGGFRARLGVDRVLTIGDDGSVYFGSGASYASHKVKVKQTGAPDVDGEPYSVWGVNSRLGATLTLPRNRSLEAFGQIENTFGWGSRDQNNSKLTQTDVTTGFHGGLRIKFGQ